MSVIKFFPTCWFVNTDWNGINVIGRLDNSRSVFIHIDWQPYFTVKYNDPKYIADTNLYLANKTPVTNIVQVDANTYRYHVKNRDDYCLVIRLYEENGSGEITDKDQSVQSKFFAQYKILPGNWQQVTNLRSLHFNVTSNDSYSLCDLEYATDSIASHDVLEISPACVDLFLSWTSINDTIMSIDLLIISLHDSKHIVLSIDSANAQSFKTEIYQSEKELLTRFYDILTKSCIDRLILFGTCIAPQVRTEGLATLDSRAEKLGVNRSMFNKVVEHRGVCIIDLQKFYQKAYMYLPDCQFENLMKSFGYNDVSTNCNYGTTGREQSMINNESYDDPLKQGYNGKQSKSQMLYTVWKDHNVNMHLSQMCNFWKNNIETILNESNDKLLDDLIRYLYPGITRDYPQPKLISKDLVPGIHSNVNVMSLSDWYLSKISTNPMIDYFRGTMYGATLFQSGYLPVIDIGIPDFYNDAISIKDNILLSTATTYPIVMSIPLMIISQESQIMVISCGSQTQDSCVVKRGFAPFVRPPFPLIQKYVDYLIEVLLNKVQKVVFPDFDTYLDDFILEMKINGQMNDPISIAINQQIREYGITSSAMQSSLHYGHSPVVKYIRTLNGPIIEKVYEANPQEYLNQLDIKWYNQELHNTLRLLL